MHRNNYAESIILAPRNLDRNTENNIRKPTTVCLLGVKDLVEKLQKICCPYDIRTILPRGMNLRKYFFKIKPPTYYKRIENCVNSIPCNCGKVYTC